MTQGICIIVDLTPRHAARCDALLAELMQATLGEPGCRGFVWGRSSDGGIVTVVERYADEGALAAHHASAHLQRLWPDIVAQLASPPRARLFVEAGGGRPEGASVSPFRRPRD